MHRCGSRFLFVLAIISAAVLTGCLGKSTGNSGNGGVQTVTITPTGNVSLDVGSTQVFSATGKSASGQIVVGFQIQFFVTVPAGSTYSSPISIASNGNACAGAWDATVSTCSPGTQGIALVTAVINGVSSTPTTVYVHQHVSSIQINRLDPQGPPLYDCFPEGQTWTFAATAYSGNLDVTDYVGPLNWAANPIGVLTATPLVVGMPPTQVFNQALITANAPGITQFFASVSGTQSAPYSYTTCLVQAVYLQVAGQNQAPNYVTVNNGSTIQLTATAVDSVYQFTGVPMPKPPLTWSTTNPEVALFTTTTNSTGSNSATARNNLGGATLTAACSPPSCNIGVLPTLPTYASNGLLPNKTPGYSAIAVDVTSASAPPTYTAWAATNECQDASGCTSALFSVVPGKTPIGTILFLPRTPNSMLFNHQASPRLYIGSSQGLMYVDFGAGSHLGVTLVSATSTPCNAALCGTLLTVSNDGKIAVVSDTSTTPNQVYVFNGSTAADLVLPGKGATAAAFSPDQSKLFILTLDGKMYVYSTVDSFASVSFAQPATDLSFSADGSFAYVAGTSPSTVSAYSTCSQPGVASVNIGSVSTVSTPLRIFPSPKIPMPVVQNNLELTSQNIVALEPPNVEILQALFAQNPIAYNDPNPTLCHPPVIPTSPPDFTSLGSFNLGLGNFLPLYSRLVANGTELILVAQNVPAVLIFNVNNGTTSSIPLVKGAIPFAADSSTDGSQIYVAACDQYESGVCTLGSVHIVNTITGGDLQQVPYLNNNDQNNNNMCNGLGQNAPLCTPNLIAIRPQ